MPTVRLSASELPAALEPIVRQRIPGAGAARIVNWAVARTGFSTETFLFDVDGVKGSDTLLGLVFRRPPEQLILPDYDLLRQYLVMHRLASSPIPVPAVRWIDTSDGPLGTPYFVMNRIDGAVGLTDVPTYHQVGVFAEADHLGRAAMWNGCIDVIAGVHLLDPDDYRLGFLRMNRFDAQTSHGWAGYLRYALDWARGGDPLHPAISRGLNWLDAHPYTPVRTVLCWGDSRMSNLLYRPDHSVAAVLDWEIAHLGDPSADLAWMLMTDWILSPHDGRAPAPGTPSRQESVDRYRDRTGHDLANMNFFEVAAPLLLAVGMLRLNVRLGMSGADLAEICARRIEFVLDG